MHRRAIPEVQEPARRAVSRMADPPRQRHRGHQTTNHHCLGSSRRPTPDLARTRFRGAQCRRLKRAPAAMCHPRSAGKRLGSRALHLPAPCRVDDRAVRIQQGVRQWAAGGNRPEAIFLRHCQREANQLPLMLSCQTTRSRHQVCRQRHHKRRASRALAWLIQGVPLASLQRAHDHGRRLELENHLWRPTNHYRGPIRHLQVLTGRAGFQMGKVPLPCPATLRLTVADQRLTRSRPPLSTRLLQQRGSGQHKERNRCLEVIPLRGAVRKH